MHVVAVRVGTPTEVRLGDRVERSGIVKEPVPEAEITADGVVGDAVLTVEHHGGPDQAVYLYGADDYAWWGIDEGRFGENLTLSTLGDGVPRIGDRYRIGEVVLEVTAPRIPCAKLAARVGEPGFVQRFADARRPGPYARVIHGGVVRPGDAVELDRADDGAVTIVDVQALHYDRSAPSEVIERVLAAPIAIRARDELERRLARRRAGGGEGE
ncbi:MAG: MOSC domain-containing protein [Actinomycetota bacterium]